MMNAKSTSVCLLIALLLLSGIVSLSAQNDQIILTVAPPVVYANRFRERYFDAFEEQHPNVKVVVVEVDHSMGYRRAAHDIEEHLDGASRYASVADLLYVRAPHNPSVESVRAGYFLDLAPLVRSDPDFDEEAWIPAVWQAFQWDNGIYAIPTAASVWVLSYDREAFDEAGLAYPDETWGMEDFAHAVRTLAIVGADGEVETPAIVAYDSPTWMRTFLQESFYSTDSQSSLPDFHRPDLAELVDEWSALVNAGYIAQTYDGSFESDQIPMDSSYLTGVARQSRYDPDWGATLFPGGVSITYTDGFAVSAGTDHPELAYALALYMSEDQSIVNIFKDMQGDVPSRWAQLDDPSTQVNALREAPEDLKPFVMRAIENALPASEFRHRGYFFNAITESIESGRDAGDALQEQQALMGTNLERDAARRDQQALVVSTPIPTPHVQPGQTVIRFRVYTTHSPLPNRREWLRLASEFTAANPQVGQVEILTNTGPFGMMNYHRGEDCFYTRYNALADLDLERLLNLDPLMAADPDFDPDDVVTGVLAQVQVGNQVYGYPLALRPELLWYDRELFASAGIPEPEGTIWETDAFLDALLTIERSDDYDEIPMSFWPTAARNQVLLFVAAFGGLPFDYRTMPPTVDLTSPEVVSAIRQVLDLAKQGTIAYYRLGPYTGHQYFGSGQSPIRADTLNTYSRSHSDIGYAPVNYPRGSLYHPASYTLSTAFISSSASDPQTCYDWISYLAAHPDLFVGVPVFEALIDGSWESTNEDMAGFYRTFSETLRSDHLVIIPSIITAENFYAEYNWLYRAFDRYVLDDADLEEELIIAEQYIREYRECVGEEALINTPETSGDQPVVIYGNCAQSVDPHLWEP